MTTAATTVVAFAVAGACSFFLPRRLRWLLVVGVLVVPIALGTPRAVREERSAAAASAVAPVYSTPPPLRWGNANPRLIAGIVEHVPAHASISIVNEDLQTGLLRWIAYSTAPRQLTTGPAPWTIVFGKTPAQAGLHHLARAWRYHSDWLVER